MLPQLLNYGIVNTHLFLNWDTHGIVDFEGTPTPIESSLAAEGPPAEPTPIDPDDTEIIPPNAWVHTADGYVPHEGGVNAKDITPSQPHSPTVTTGDFDSLDGGSIPPVAATPRANWRRL